MDDTDDGGFSVDRVIGNSPRIFRNKSLVSVGTVPDEERIVGRQEEITNVALSLEDIIYNDVPDNIQIYGKTGTGKSLVSRHVSSKITERAQDNGVTRRTSTSTATPTIPSRELPVHSTSPSTTS